MALSHDTVTSAVITVSSPCVRYFERSDIAQINCYSQEVQEYVDVITVQYHRGNASKKGNFSSLCCNLRLGSKHRAL